MSAEATIEQVIQNALDKSDELINEAMNATDEMLLAAQSYAYTGLAPVVSFSGVDIQPFNPSEDLGDMFKLEYGNTLDGLRGDFDSLIAGWLNDYFPNFTCTKAEDWICDTIENGGQGLPVDIEEAIYSRARDRQNQESFMLEQDAVDGFASMGFTMPSGHLNAVLRSVREKSYDAIAQQNRDIAIEQAKIRLDTLKFAVEQANNLRLNVWKAIMDGIGAYMNLGNDALARANAIVAAKRGLWDSTAAYYDALVKVASLDLDAQKATGQFKMGAYELDAGLWKTTYSGRVQATEAAARILSGVASAYASAQNTIANIGNVTTISA